MGVTASKPAEVAIPQALELAGDLLDQGALGGQQRLGIVEPGEGADFLGEALRTEPVARRQVPLRPGLAQLLQAGGQVAGIVLLHGGFEERLDLLAQGLVLGRCEPVPEPLPAQGDLDRLPRLLVGLGEGLGQPLAVVGEVAPNLLGHLLDPVAGDLAGGLLGDTTQDLGAVLDDNFGHAAHDLGIKDMPHGERRGLLVDQHRSLAREGPDCDVARLRQRSPSHRGRSHLLIYTSKPFVASGSFIRPLRRQDARFAPPLPGAH